MAELKYILGLPEYIKKVGAIYPIKVKDYDLFNECSSVLLISKQHFHLDQADYPLLDLIIALQDENIIKKLEQLFSLVTRKKVVFIISGELYGFLIDESNVIDSNNYEFVRQTIMKQNLLFEPKVYQDKLTQQWAQKVIEAKQKNSIKVTYEDKINLVHIFTGLSYNQIAEQTIYQLEADFERINKMKGFDLAVSFKCAGAERVNIEHFAEHMNMFENPYDKVFVTKDKLKKIDNALN